MTLAGRNWMCCFALVIANRIDHQHPITISSITLLTHFFCHSRFFKRVFRVIFFWFFRCNQLHGGMQSACYCLNDDVMLVNGFFNLVVVPSDEHMPCLIQETLNCIQSQLDHRIMLFFLLLCSLHIRLYVLVK